MTNLTTLHIGVDLAGLLGGRMASAEGGSLPSGGGVSPLQPLRGRVPAKKRILAYFQGHRTLIFVPIGYDKIWGGTICIIVPPLQILGGDLPPCLPVIYVHDPSLLFC